MLTVDTVNSVAFSKDKFRRIPPLVFSRSTGSAVWNCASGPGTIKLGETLHCSMPNTKIPDSSHSEGDANPPLHSPARSPGSRTTPSRHHPGSRGTRNLREVGNSCPNRGGGHRCRRAHLPSKTRTHHNPGIFAARLFSGTAGAGPLSVASSPLGRCSERGFACPRRDSGRRLLLLYNRAVEFADQLPTYSSKIRELIGKISSKANRIESGTRSAVEPPQPAKQPVTVKVQQPPGLTELISENGGTIMDVLMAIGFVPFLVYFMLMS